MESLSSTKRKTQTMQLMLLLQNLYNAPWPKEFNSEAFCLPDEDATAIQKSTQISYRYMDDKEMQDMAKVLISENESMRGTIFFNQWVLPLEVYFQANKISTK